MYLAKSFTVTALFDLNWMSIFSPTLPIFEIFLRGSIMYLALFLLLRIVLKRETGTVGITDMLTIVLLADAAQNAMAASYQSITEGILLVTTILFWNYALNWLGYYIPALNRIVHPPPLLLVKDGRMLFKNMREELITKDELMSLLRKQGVEDITEVKKAFMEGDGSISVVTGTDKDIPHSPPDKKVP